MNKVLLRPFIQKERSIRQERTEHTVRKNGAYGKKERSCPELCSVGNLLIHICSNCGKLLREKGKCPYCGAVNI